MPYFVSTHSRLKAAGYEQTINCRSYGVSTHSRLKAAGHEKQLEPENSHNVSTYSRLKAAGPSIDANPTPFVVSTHSRLKAAGLSNITPNFLAYRFNTQPPEGGWKSNF